MKITTTMISLRSDDSEPPRVVPIRGGNKGCNVWIGGIVLVGDAQAWRDLAAVALQAAAIEDEADSPGPYQLKQKEAKP